MIQHRGSINNFLINNAYKLKKKQGLAQTYPILNLKNRCVCFSKQQNNEDMCLKKPTVFFVKTPLFLLITLIFDFTTLIKQIVVKNNCFFIKTPSKKYEMFQKNTDVFIKTVSMFFYHNTD